MCESCYRDFAPKRARFPIEDVDNTLSGTATKMLSSAGKSDPVVAPYLRVDRNLDDMSEVLQRKIDEAMAASDVSMDALAAPLIEACKGSHLSRQPGLTTIFELVSDVSSKALADRRLCAEGTSDTDLWFH